METTANQGFNKVNTQAPWLSHISLDIRKKNYNIKDISNDKSHNELSYLLNQLLDEVFLASDKSMLHTGRGLPLEFVPQSVLDDINQTIPTAYETHIANTGQIPTRNNLHDFFNAWMWLTFPKTKALLNRYQAEQIESEGISNSRGRIRDAITVLDENGAILITSNPNIAEALQSFDWQNCLVEPREQWVDMSMSESGTITNNLDQQAMVMICGHALLEQLVEPRKPLCAHTFIVQVEPTFFSLPLLEQVQHVDELLVDKVGSWLQQEDVSPRQLSPLPILGVPYFWSENSNKEFYNDDFVFRSGRRKKK